MDLLVAEPPVAGTPLRAGPAGKTARAVMTFWYIGEMDGAPVPDRASAYYQLIAWKAMYTFPGSVCRGFGTWADAPKLTADLAAN